MENDVWRDDDTFDKAKARFVMKRGACKDALMQIGVSVGDVASRFPGLSLWFAADKLTPERIDACAEEAPWAALKYAADRLTPKRLQWCKRKTSNEL